jgi:hypoxanthine phosphoribosyltransferase
MITHNILYSKSDIETKTKLCALFIDDISWKAPTVLCPIMQSSYQFVSDISKHLSTTPQLDFYGISRYADDGTEDELYLYKGADQSLMDNKTVIIIDTLCTTGTTIDAAARLSKQLGAKKVYTVSLLYRQFSVHKPNWYGWKISDESVYGYGLDNKTNYRTLPYIAHE